MVITTSKLNSSIVFSLEIFGGPKDEEPSAKDRGTQTLFQKWVCELAFPSWRMRSAANIWL